MSTPSTFFAPLSAATGSPVPLTMQRLFLAGQVLPAGARLTVQHVFRSGEPKPLEVIYAFPLPRDAALRSFRISGDGFEAHSELRDTEEAVKAYEQGIAQGALSTLARQHEDGVINLHVGNIRPNEAITVWLDILAGVELRDDGFRFRFPFTLAPAYHAGAKSTVAGLGEGRIDLPPHEFGYVVLPPFREDATRLHQVGFDLALASRLPLAEISSPSHALKLSLQEAAPSRVSLAPETDLPDRDLVLDVRYREVAPQVLAGRDAQGKQHFAAVIPSSSFGDNPESAHRVVILLDRSGSMQGAPLAQAVRAVKACLGALSEEDSFGLVAFDDRVESFRPTLLSGSRANRDQARQFLDQVDARGGTELARGVAEAVRVLGGGGGDIFVLTDGQVAGTGRILADARATQTRLHCLGIGSASQDRFLALLARETGGVSRFVTARERVDLAAVDLFASVGRPIASGLTAGLYVQPDPPAAVFSGTPVLLFGEIEPDREPRIDLRWQGGELSLPVSSPNGDPAETVRLLKGSRLITDYEARYPRDESGGALGHTRNNRVAARLRDLSSTYGLASREISLVAVVQRTGDRPGELPETRVVPVGMPQDTAFGSYFGGATTAAMLAAAPQVRAGASRFMAAAPAHFTRMIGASSPASPPQSPADSADDLLFDLASRIEPDGGMPGKDTEARAANTAVALFAFLAQGHTAASGAFRSHVARLVKFLESLRGLPADRQKAIASVLEAARQGRAPKGDWQSLARSPGKKAWEALAAHS